MKKTNGLFKRILRIFYWMLISSSIYLMICTWIMPPITITQIVQGVQYGLKRDYVAYDKMSKHVKLAAIASEDQAFTDHHGFDWEALRKSLDPQKPSKKKKKLPRGAGASTISQQVAKNVFLWQGSGFTKYLRKIPEFWFTAWIELVWGKERILEVYLNCIEMGPGIFGIEAAAQHYFNKSAAKLTKQEAAQIIACLPNPKKYTVVPMSRFVGWKKNWILRQMNNLEDDPDIQELIK